MGERKNCSNVLPFFLEMCGEYDGVLSSILRQRPLSPNNRQWRNMNMSTMMVLILLGLFEDVIRLNSSMCLSNAAGQVLLKKKNG